MILNFSKWEFSRIQTETVKRKKIEFVVYTDPEGIEHKVEKAKIDAGKDEQYSTDEMLYQKYMGTYVP